MPNHNALSGDELHGTKIKTDTPTRAPAFVGELIYDATTKRLWIATTTAANGWVQPFAAQETATPTPSASSPIVFSWALDLDLVTGTSGYGIEFYFASSSATLNNEASWTSLGLRTFEEEDLARRSVIDFSDWITRYGKGHYLFAQYGLNATTGAPTAINNTLALLSANTSVAAADTYVQIVNIPSLSLGGKTYTNIKAAKVLKPLAQVVLKLS